MIKVTRSSLVTAKLKTSCRTRRGRAIKYLGCSTLKIILILCYITGVYCERYEWRISRYFKDLRAAMGRRPQTSLLGHCNFEEICDWNWNPGEKFRRVTPATAGKLGPATDASNLKKGHFLWQQGRGQSQVSSNLIPRTGSHCYLEIAFYQYEMKETIIKLIIATADMTWVVAERLGNNDARWQIEKFNLGAITQPYHLYFEIDFPYLNSSLGIDNIRLVDCFPELPPDKTVCTEITFRCKNGSCLNRTRVCDLTKDCADGEDEEGDCDKMPENSRCNFENGWCGWTNVSGRLLNWNLHRGSTPHERLGPSYDHTYLNETGTFAYVNISRRSEYFSKGTIESPLFNPTPPYSSDPNSPYHQSCQVRFFYHQYGVASGSLGLYLVQVKPHQNHSEFLWWSYGDKSNDWFNEAIVLPEIKHRFFFQFEASQGYTTKGILAIDDFSLSPECFGIGVPPEVVGSFNYSNPIIESERIPDQHADFVNETVIRVTTCGATGRMGPTVEQCAQKYNKTDVKVVVPSLIPAVEGMPIYNLNGTQRWSAPHGGYYTLIGMGARGGRGSGDTGSTLGASVRGIIELEKGEQLYFMVGQAGTDACPKNLGQRMSECQMSERPTASTGVQSVLEKVRTMNVKDGGGGGGGATYIFTLKNNNEQHPLLIAAGGGGLGLGQFVDDGIQHGRGGAPPDKLPSSGLTITKDAGPGGGWNSSTNNILGHRIMSGMPLVRGGIGGTGCGTSLEGNGNGGFGGGGGGCLTGGGGGGYIGGSTGLKGSGNGEGGYSYAAPQLLHVSFKPEANPGPGEVYIIPAISGCGCDFRCVALDQYLSETKCLCSPGWLLGNDSRSCNMVNDTKVSHQAFMILLITVSIGLLLAFVGFCLLLYNRYQNRKALLRRRQVMFGNGTELTALRVVSDTMMTEFNPNYEFAGNLYSFKDLTQIPREYITLVKPLGQGAFGEVFQGIYKQRRNEEHPVAVKTLPCLTTFQAEADFMMEALIMSKFSHPNIVHFIGVSFEKHPRYIILELLAGGDLKNFLREERPKPDRPTTLTMHDLITCGSDIASGCKYMEEARFIHRDIAARNCLLTCKGPGRMVKIADFGMARDIYRSDYYRKGGKAMLPIKWMPPESFLDGIFTTKTDVWAFGVLLWELMSFGYMPYTGCANREVMTMVTSGGRLEKPAGCPDPIYGIMTRCWHPRPDDRPSFATITERLGYCLQDPDVINHPMPNYDLLPACDREITIMRPDPETECINVHSDTALLEMCGYIQSRDTEFRPSTYRIGAHVPSGTSYVCQKRSDYNPLNDNFRTRSKNAQLQQLHRNPHKNFRKDSRNVYGNNNAKDDDDRNDCKRKNDDDNDKDNDKNNDNDKEEGEAKNEVENKDKDETKDNNKMRPYECKKENDDDDNVDTTSKDVDETLSGHRDNTMIDIVDRKNGNESTTTTDTNSATPTDTPMDTPTDTATNSSPNTSTCSPSQTIANETSTTSTTNVNGMVKKSALKAALSLDPSALYRGAIHYEKISFSTSQLPSTTTSATTQTTTSSSSQRSAAPGSIELRKDLLGHKLPREEECSC